jgi:hypothetical protein
MNYNDLQEVGNTSKPSLQAIETSPNLGRDVSHRSIPDDSKENIN